MTDSTLHAPDDLDAGWDEDDKVPTARLQSLPPTAALEQLEAGWEQVAASPAPTGPSLPASADVDELDDGWNRPASTQQIDSIDEHEAASNADKKPTKKFGKKDRRQLERQARAHQLERSHDNRKLRKDHRRELAKQRALSAHDTQRNELERPSHERKQQPAAPREKAAQPKSAARTTTTHSPAPPKAPGVQDAAAPNRAARRSKAGRTNPQSSPQHAAPPSESTRRFGVGPFALFITVVFVLSVLSYLLIR